MAYINEQITQEILDAIGEPVERVFRSEAVKGLLFVEVFGGRIAVFNPALKQALRHRWNSVEECIAFLVRKRILEVNS